MDSDSLINDFFDTYFQENLGAGLNLAFYSEGKWMDFSRGQIDDRKIPTSPEIWYDIASFTKTFTATQILFLIEENKLSLDQPASDTIPYLNGFTTTIEDLLTHKSGLHRRQNYKKNIAYTPAEIQQIFYNQDNLFEINPGHYFYTDTNYIILGDILSKLTNKGLQDNLEEFCKRFNLSEISYKPLEFGKIQPESIAKSELNQPIGVVQDEKARLFGGLSGHAGMFATLNGLKSFVEAWVEKKFNLNENLFNQATKPLFDHQHKYFFQATLDKLQISNMSIFEEAYGLVWRLGVYSIFPNHSGFAGPIAVFNPNNNKALVITHNITFPVRNPDKKARIIEKVHQFSSAILV
jgi:CubicO group peptidase (beta-lactamase class C family)